MVTKKNVFVMVLVFLMVAGLVSAGAIGRGGFGVGAVVASDADDSTVRPFQRWQDLSAEELAECPICGNDFDPETIRAIIAQRTALRANAQASAPSFAMGRQGMAATPVASYGPNRAPAASYGQNRAQAASYGQNRAPMKGRAVNTRPGMHSAQPAGGASYGPAWAR